MKNQITDKSHFTVCAKLLRRRSFKLIVYDEFFKNEIVYKIYSDRIEFRKPTLSDRKYILNPNKTKTGYSFTISGDLDLNTGSYNFEEIEDNDIRIFYL